MIYYVNAAAPADGDGSRENPFAHIQQAADIAVAGDEVLVAPGIYREWVNPKHAGTETAPVIYRSEEKYGAVITGSEPVPDWTDEGGGVYSARVSNALFGEYNPYTTPVEGDWFTPNGAHTGEIYLNGKAMYEVTAKEKVFSPEKSPSSWDPDFSVYVWFAEQDEVTDETVIYANFQGADPGEADVEINVRRNCFLPAEEGVGYITVSGFEICRAACQWAPPTAYQDGMIGPHWSKGWVIEDCRIHDAKCSGISLGKYLQPENDNKWLKWKYKDGTQTERECICQAQREGWTKECIGSHTVRHCDIYDCGQTGIVGHLGGVFSVIEDNHIHNINNRQNLSGAEIGGIKMHAAIDVTIRRNHIHHCTRGLWLDWQAQGTRVTQNCFHHNNLPVPMEAASITRELFMGIGEDVFVEVSHGPTLIDNNLLLSDRALKLASQGIACVHNLIAGSIAAVGIGTENGASIPSPRYTPYHVPHRTEIAGFMTFMHGDVRFYNNIFFQQPVRPAFAMIQQAMDGTNDWEDGNIQAGLHRYNGYPDFAEWDKQFEGYCGMGSEGPSDRYYTHLPVWAAGNAYLNGAQPWDRETDPVVAETEASWEIAEAENGWELRTNLYELLGGAAGQQISTETLGMAFEPEQRYENPDGSPIVFDWDYEDQSRGEHPLPGPFAEGKACIRF